MKNLHLITLLSFYVLLSACSPIDSVHPFDQQQAAKLLQSTHGQIYDW